MLQVKPLVADELRSKALTGSGGLQEIWEMWEFIGRIPIIFLFTHKNTQPRAPQHRRHHRHR